MDTSIGHVVVGFDGSGGARSALRWGVHEALSWDAKLDVVVAAGDPFPEVGRPSLGEDHWAREWAHHATDMLEGSPLTQWQVSVREGKAREVLSQSSRPGTVTVVGSCGHGTAGGVVLGSVSQHLTRSAAGPVVVVRGEDDLWPGRVAVGINGSPESRVALDFALAHASAAKVPLSVVFAWQPTPRLSAFAAGAVPTGAVLGPEDADRWLAEFAAGRSDRYPDVVVERTVVQAPSVEALIDASATVGLLVVGSRGLGVITEAVLGSVSQTVLRKSHCPVAVVR
jgi:nucleotide-binding universal stress UspA family protein